MTETFRDGREARSVRPKKRRAQGDDFRTFLAEFMSIRPQAEVRTPIEALIY